MLQGLEACHMMFGLGVGRALTSGVYSRAQIFMSCDPDTSASPLKGSVSSSAVQGPRALTEGTVTRHRWPLVSACFPP